MNKHYLLKFLIFLYVFINNEYINKRSLELANARLNQHDSVLQEETDYEKVDKVAMKLRMMITKNKLSKKEFKTVMDAINYLDEYQGVLKNDY